MASSPALWKPDRYTSRNAACAPACAPDRAAQPRFLSFGYYSPKDLSYPATYHSVCTLRPRFVDPDFLPVLPNLTTWRAVVPNAKVTMTGPTGKPFMPPAATPERYSSGALVPGTAPGKRV